jgi:uncharacterized lipoprotein YmbA
MKVAAYRKTATVLALACLLSLAACAGGNAPVHFYMLSPLPKTESAAILNTDMPTIGVGPVTMAAYLDRPQLITRSEQNRLQIHDSKQWAEIPKSAFLRVLTQNLSILLGSNQVFAFPWRREADIRYQVIVDVDRFDGEGSKTAVLQASWSIVDTERHKILVKKRVDIRQPSEGDGYDDLVEAQSRALADLSRQIAEAVKAALTKS